MFRKESLRESKQLSEQFIQETHTQILLTPSKIYKSLFINQQLNCLGELLPIEDLVTSLVEKDPEGTNDDCRWEEMIHGIAFS